MIRIHLFESSSTQQICVVDDRPNRRVKEINVRRSCPIFINILQTEDKYGYGTQFRAIPKFNTGDKPSSLTWTLFAILSSCPELWIIVDNKPTPFKWSGWEGWILTSIQKFCFEFETITIDKRSPISKLTSLSAITDKVNKFYRNENNNDEEDPNNFYHCNTDSMHRLFQEDDYSSSVVIIDYDYVEEATLENINDVENKKAIIIAGIDEPTEEYININDIEFELRVICIARAKNKGRTASTYEAIRYMRHGHGFSSWWKQERNDDIVTQYHKDEELLYHIHVNNIDCYFKFNVCVYIRKETKNVDKWRTTFFESMGGKSHVRCNCHAFPLIPSHRKKLNKKRCNAKLYVCEDGNQRQIQQEECQRKESYICSDVNCSIRICKKCYDSLSIDNINNLIPDQNITEDIIQMDISDQSDNNIISQEDENSTDNDDNFTYFEINDEVVEETDSLDIDIIVNSPIDETLDTSIDNVVNDEGFTTTDAGDEPVNIQQNETMISVAGHVIFNQVGKCTTRHKQTINGTSRQKYIVQSLCATTPGQASPLIQPESSIFPRHFYISATNDECSILGAQPLFLLCSKTHPYGFASVLDHARMHMTNPSSTTSTDPNFMCLYFDILGNMVMSKCHSRDIFERGFVVDNKSAYGMSVREQNHTKLSGSVDSRRMVMNLASSQKYIKYTWFLTFTANQSEHPGLSHLHEWKNSSKWTRNIPNYDSFSVFEKSEFRKAMEQTYGVHLYNNWNTVKLMLLKHIKEHISVLGTSSAIFGRDEYQGDAGNLAHNHAIIAIDKRTMNGNTEKYIQDLIRTSIFDIIKSDKDIDRLLENGILKSVDEIVEITARANEILRHHCNERCKMRVNVGKGDRDFRCRKMHSVKDCPDPTKHNYVPVKHKYQKATLDILKEVGIFIPIENISDFDVLQDESTKIYKGMFTHPYFNPKRHIAPCNFNATCNISPVISDFFISLKSMQNAQALDHTNGIAKYVCKYITKFDDGNYVILCQDIHTGQWVLGKRHLHNTKIVTSKYNEDKAFAKDRNKLHPRGRDMPHFEIRQILLGDPEVFTNMNFVQIPTLPFELRPTNSIKLDTQGNVINNDIDEEEHPSDAYTSGAPMQQIRSRSNLSEHQQMTSNQHLTYRNHHGKTSKYDMVSIFSLRPPELLGVFRNPIDYFRYCHIDHKQMKNIDIEEALSENIQNCAWIDCFGRKVRINILAIDEVLIMIEKNLNEYRNIDSPNTAQRFAYDMNLCIIGLIRMFNSPDNTIGDNMMDIMNIFFYKGEEDLLPIPVVSGTSPSNAHQFLTHILLSLGKYNTEIDVLVHPTIRDSIRYVGLIGDATDEDSLKQYSAKLLDKYIREQLVHYPNSLNKTEVFLSMAKRVFDDAIIHNALSMNELPPFTMTGLRLKQTESNNRFWTSNKEAQLQSIYTVLRHMDNIPSKDEIMSVNRETPMVWNPVRNLSQFINQSEESFLEQKEAIQWIVKQINKYRNTNGQESMTCTNNIIVYGAPGSGKSFVAQYSVLYAISQALNTISTTLMGIRANALGGIHLHKLFKFDIDSNTTSSPYRMAESSLQKIHRDRTLLHALVTLDVIFLDEAGQTSAEQLSAIDIILRTKRDSQIPFGGVLIIGTMDPKQLQPIAQLPFLTSSLMLTCFRMFELKQSVRAHGDPDFHRLQTISRMNPFELLASTELKNEFFELAKQLTYVRDWNDNRIGPNMMRAFSRIRPAQDALKEYCQSIINQLSNDRLPFCISKSRDMQRTRGTNAEYIEASIQSIKFLTKELKEPAELVFFVGGIYECTINDPNGQFSQSQLAFMMDLPSQETIDKFDSIPLWIAPPGTQHIEFDRDNLPSRNELIENAWVEVRIGCAPERLIPARYGIQAKRLQYSLKHIGATTINKAQGATLPLGLAVEISEEYSPWESGQIVVALSRTTSARMTIVVGERNYAINKMWELITSYNQWTQYIKHVLDIITINRNQNEQNQHIFDYPEVYPFRLRDIILPQDTTGFVYFLVSKRNINQVYIGQTKCISQRLAQHNNGTGSSGTTDIMYRPWGVAAYICGLSHMSTRERMSLERSWKLLIEDMRTRGIDDSYAWIDAGARIVETYNNRYDIDERIIFTRCISPREV